MKEQDCLRRFLFEELGVRGEWVCLQESWQAAKQYQSLNTVVENQLGQALAAVTLLSATIKFEGSLILQAQGDGALRTLVAQATHDKKIRGLVRCVDNVTEGNLQQMMGQGRLAITIEPKKGEPYQGIVPLSGEGLEDVIRHYFLQSEQLETRLWLFANQTRAVGLLLQALPTQENDKADWDRIEILANTITEEELLNLDCEEILYRLFNQEKVKLFDSEPVEFKCSCSKERISTTLYSLGKMELDDILAQHQVIDVGCEFCGHHYEFNEQDVSAILRQGQQN